MADARQIPVVYSPRTLGEALGLFVPNPHALIYAGGTAWQQENLTSPLKLPPVTLSLHLVDDLKKLTYGDRFLDLGAGITLNQILHANRSFLNPALKEAILAVGNYSLRNLATLGGNLCQKNFLGDLFPVLHLLGAQFEIRSLRTSRWINAFAVSDQGKMGLLPGEVLTRIRIPQEDWPRYYYQKIGNFRTPWDERLAMVCLARVKSSTLENFRLAFYLPHSGVLRDRALEAELAGQRLPLSPKERSAALESIEEGLSRQPIPASVFQRDRILHMTRWLLSQIQSD